MNRTKERLDYLGGIWNSISPIRQFMILVFVLVETTRIMNIPVGRIIFTLAAASCFYFVVLVVVYYPQLTLSASIVVGYLASRHAKLIP